MKKLILTMLLAVFLVSCDELLDIILDDDTPLEPDQFYAVNFTNNSFYKVRAKILTEGEKCVIWAENGSGVTEAKAKEIADKYDKVIRPKIVDTFSMKNFTESGKNYTDILDYANTLANKENKKLTILLLNIKDSFKVITDPYVAGYFYSGNFYTRNERNSNGCDMIFVDTYPGLEYMPEQTYATFAHELQHLVNFATTVLVDRKNSNGNMSVMDTWIDEGLSSQAEHIYYEGVSFPDKEKTFDGNIIEHYKRINNSATIAKGNNFFVWGNHPEDKNAILDEYATVYLFFRWLYLQADSELKKSIFLNIETSTSSDHTVIIDVAKKINLNWNNWDTVLSSWLAANYYPTNSNYGYKDNYFKDIKVKQLSTTSTPLYPGEGVYSSINKPFTPQAGGKNIRYARLPDNTSNIATQTPFNSGVLLTYNVSTNSDKDTAKPETGTLTGVAASVSSSTNSRALMVEDTQKPTGPHRIDARDYDSGGILGRNK
jgi:hypothetical protein